ncbi:YciI family protein [Streptosporangium sp. NPDC050855]|uniref:YciI family protein n=1 Tax=Streptosporangium sp. NPDC050855 TaxID=3366194 RepID=UPI0037AC3116
MKVMVMIKINGADEAGITMTPEMAAAMDAYNEKLTKAGIMLDGTGLGSSSGGAQVVFEGGTTSVVDGPFTESKEIVVGFWIWQVSSVEEAVEWARQCPVHPDGAREVLEVRPVHEEGDPEAAGARG